MEKNGIWTESFCLHAYMVDKNREATLPTLLNFFQEVANGHAFNRQYDFFSMQERGLIWVLNRLNINVLRYPSWQETLRVSTWVSQFAAFPHRHLEIVDNEGNVVCCAYSIWLSLDAETHRPRRILDFDSPLSEKKTSCHLPQKLQNIEGVVTSERRVVYSDLDMLGHVNNVKYVEWMLDALHAIEPNIKPKNMEINYINEAFLNEDVLFLTKKEDIKMYFTLKRKSDETDICRASFDIKKEDFQP
jgi:medium-chain acyl-[acyl-carrier-protein] hydrolase